MKEGPRDRSTSLGLLVSFFFFSFHYFIANKHFYTGLIHVTTTLQAPGCDDETNVPWAVGKFLFFLLISLFLLTNFF